MKIKKISYFSIIFIALLICMFNIRGVNAESNSVIAQGVIPNTSVTWKIENNVLVIGAGGAIM